MPRIRCGWYLVEMCGAAGMWWSCAVRLVTSPPVLSAGGLPPWPLTAPPPALLGRRLDQPGVVACRRTDQPGAVACPVCGKWFSGKASLGNHKPIHAGRTTCTICGHVYGSMHNLRMHLRRAHGQELAAAATGEGHFGGPAGEGHFSGPAGGEHEGTVAQARGLGHWSPSSLAVQSIVEKQEPGLE